MLLIRAIIYPSISKVVIAYEPVWAIGTGKVATPEQVCKHHFGVLYGSLMSRNFFTRPRKFTKKFGHGLLGILERRWLIVPASFMVGVLPLPTVLNWVWVLSEGHSKDNPLIIRCSPPT